MENEIKDRIKEVIRYIKEDFDYYKGKIPDDIEDVDIEYVLREDVDYILRMLENLLEDKE